jgi:regulatory protein
VRPDAATLARLKDTEAERARAVWAARFGRAPADAAERARQMRFLAQRGFSAETIRSVLDAPSAAE